MLLAARDRDRMRVDEARDPGENMDVVPRQLVADDVDLALDHLTRAHGQVLDGDLILDAVAVAVDGALAEPGQVDDRLAESLGRDRSAIDRNAAKLAPFHDRRAPSKLGRLDRRLLPRGAGADDQKFVVEAVVHGE